MVIPVGQITDPNQKLCEDINLEWATEFRILGFNIDNKLERLHSNIESCTRKVRAKINKWRKYNLTLMGRMTVAVYVHSNSPEPIHKRNRIHPINT